MSQRLDSERLQDILEAAQLIAEFVGGVDHAAFVSNQKDRSAVAYQLVIIGEAVAHLSNHLKERNPEIPWKAIKGLRNIAAHEYRRLDFDTVWLAAATEVPKLAEQVARILDAMQHGGESKRS